MSRNATVLVSLNLPERPFDIAELACGRAGVERRYFGDRLKTTSDPVTKPALMIQTVDQEHEPIQKGVAGVGGAVAA
jgi:hypothetical protein